MSQSFPFPVTLLVLLFFIAVAVVPRLPLIARIVITLGAGLGIYFGMREATFALWKGAKISELFGGDAGMGEFNKFALGFIATVLGLIVTLIAAVVRKLLSKGKEE